MAKATIKSKSGLVITIEGSEGEVSSILSVFERATTIGYTKKAVTKSKRAAKEEKKRLGASDLIITLKEEGFFEKPESLGGYFKSS